MAQRDPARTEHVRRRRLSRGVRVGAIQGVCALAGLALALLAARVPWEPLFGETAVLPVMLGMAFSIVGLVTIIFSLLFTVVQWVYGTFSLRLRRFEDRPMAWWAFGITIGVFVYSLVAALLTLRNNEVSWVVPAITFAGALVTLMMLRRLQLDAFRSVQLGPTLLDLCATGLAAVDARYPDGLGERPAEAHAGTAPGDGSASAEATAVIWRGLPTVLQYVDEDRLVAAARRAGAFVRLSVPIGGLLVPGEVIAEVQGSTRVPIARALTTGSDRSTEQDPQWVLRLVTDIALKALSSAINDPATAVQAMDCLEVVLARLVRRDLAVGSLRAPDGQIVAEVPVPTLSATLSDVFDDLAVAAAPLPLAARRLERLVGALEPITPAAGREVLIAARNRLAQGRADRRAATGSVEAAT